MSWLPGFLEGGSEVRLAPAPLMDADDPSAAWYEHVRRVQALLDDPATEALTFSDPHLGEMALATAIDQFYTADVFMHTWDLARATGQDDQLDERRCQEMFERMLPFEGALRASGQYGSRVEVPEDASYQDKLLGLIGRQP